jgi:cbb3-type cytochrome oxidase cytochrome c subunit
MNNGPLLFLGSFVAMLLSWLGLIVAPQVQLRDLQPAKNEITGQFYPNQRLGLARQGAEVYRAHACYSCHTMQVRQTGYNFQVFIQKAGSDEDALIQGLMEVQKISEEEAMIFGEGDTLEIRSIDLGRKSRIESIWEDTPAYAAGARLGFRFIPLGPDIQRGWGARASVARDYLYDETLMLGQNRVGPDLSNIGTRNPDRDWHLKHLYHPRTVMEASTMPAYPFLFETRRIGEAPSPNALKLEDEFAPEEGFEVVPTEEALALVAYLQSQRNTEGLYEAPVTPPAQ